MLDFNKNSPYGAESVTIDCFTYIHTIDAKKYAYLLIYEGESSIEYNLAVAPLFLNKILVKWTQNEAFLTVHLKKLSNFNFDSA